MAGTKGKMGPVYTRPNAPQGGPPGMFQAPAESEVKDAKTDFLKGSKGRKVNF